MTTFKQMALLTAPKDDSPICKHLTWRQAYDKALAIVLAEIRSENCSTEMLHVGMIAHEIRAAYVIAQLNASRVPQAGATLHFMCEKAKQDAGAFVIKMADTAGLYGEFVAAEREKTQ